MNNRDSIRRNNDIYFIYNIFIINNLSGGGGGRTRVLEQGLDRFYKFVRAYIVGRQVVARLTPSP